MVSQLDIESQEWDAVIVGTGMGGATLGFALARAGWRVLFCDQGRSRLGRADSIVDCYPEERFERPGVPEPRHADILMRAGRWAEQIEDRSTPRARRFVPFVGSGSGGSTSLYGMVLERFFPEDFNPRSNFPAVDSAALPDAWPISFRELEPYYRDSERLFEIRGSADPLRQDTASAPLRSPPPVDPANQELFTFLEGKKAHPYRIPMACGHVEDCHGCQGFLCPKACKRDSATVCLEPALTRFGAQLLDQCKVIRLRSDPHTVTGIECDWKGREVNLKGRVVVLAAGALQTPAILLRSRSQLWPEGLANSSGLVGRNLMRHFVDLYAIKTRAAPHPQLNVKEIGFNDFYKHKGLKLGSVQSFGRLPPPDMIAYALRDEVRHSHGAHLAALLGLAMPLVRRAIAGKLNGSVLLASIAEDLPYHDNRVSVDTSDPSVPLILEYRIAGEGHDRIAAFRTAMATMLKPYRFSLLKQAENNERLAHVSGTCRFGTEPSQSVLDRNNRAHDLANLYVVDSSFFPSSGGTNPSLTVAANALRVAEHLIEERSSRIGERDSDRKLSNEARLH